LSTRRGIVLKIPPVCDTYSPRENTRKQYLAYLQRKNEIKTRAKQTKTTHINDGNGKYTPYNIARDKITG
jgi:hypothetical protein